MRGRKTFDRLLVLVPLLLVIVICLIAHLLI